MSKIRKNKEEYLTKCPCCDNNLILKAKNEEPTHILPTDFDLVASRVLPDEPKRPPASLSGVGDWVVGRFSWGAKPQKIDYIKNGRVYCGGEEDAYWILGDVRIVRRSTDRLQKGDRGLLDGKIEVWLAAGGLYFGNLTVVFNTRAIGVVHNVGVEEAHIRPDRFTLVEPVYDRKED